jgi:mono/diheme cytochrome c family protein
LRFSIQNVLICKLIFLCALSGLLARITAAREGQATKARPAPLSGAQLYKQNCEVCHGDDGKGNGPPPASSPFIESPPDLTTLAKRHKGEFPDAYVAEVLRNGVKMPDHGPAEMPIWGIVFKSMSKSDETQAKLRIANLTNYLKSIQAK